jgi:hypothetical protein
MEKHNCKSSVDIVKINKLSKKVKRNYGTLINSGKDTVNISFDSEIVVVGQSRSSNLSFNSLPPQY